MEPAGRGASVRGRPAEIGAALAFVYSLLATVILLALTSMFSGEEDRRTVLAWLAMPIVLSFVSWLAVRSGTWALRVVVWVSVLLCLFFCWISIFSIGVYYLPVVVLLIVAGFGPWPRPDSDKKDF